MDTTGASRVEARQITMKVLILAAGYATRLYPLTQEYPKPLLLVGGRPIIDYILDKLEAPKEIGEIIVVTNSKFISHFRKWKQGLKIKKRISLIDDLTSSQYDRRGAIGDMHFVIRRKKLREDLLVIGGDNLFDAGLKGFLAFVHAKRSHPVIGAYDVKKRKLATHYGVLKLDQDKRIVYFQEKPSQPVSTLAAMCLYYFPKSKLALVDEYLMHKANKHDATGFYIDWLYQKETVYCFVFTGRWYDIGHHKFYNEAKKAFVK